MRTDITFLIDSRSLPNKGPSNPATYDDPIAIHHFPMRVVHDNGPVTDVRAGDPVRVSRGDQVNIYTMDYSLLPHNRIAPVKINAHDWTPQGGAPYVLTASDMDNPAKKPIDQPRFDDSFPELPKLNYTGTESAWANVTPADHLWWSDGAECGQDVRGSVAQLYGPYMTFNAQRHRGMLRYGIEFAVGSIDENTGSTNILYYYFDPRIQIQ